MDKILIRFRFSIQHIKQIEFLSDYYLSGLNELCSPGKGMRTKTAAVWHKDL